MTGNVFTCLLLAIDVKSCLAISQSCDQRTFPRSYYMYMFLYVISSVYYYIACIIICIPLYYL